MENKCVIVFIGAKNYVNFTVMKAIIRSIGFPAKMHTDCTAISYEDEALFERRTLGILKLFCKSENLVFVTDDTRVNKNFDEATNTPASVDMDAAEEIRRRINSMPGPGYCKGIVAIDMTDMEHEAELRGTGLDVNEVKANADLVIEQIKRIYRN